MHLVLECGGSILFRSPDLCRRIYTMMRTAGQRASGYWRQDGPWYGARYHPLSLFPAASLTSRQEADGCPSNSELIVVGCNLSMQQTKSVVLFCSDPQGYPSSRVIQSSFQSMYYSKRVHIDVPLYTCPQLLITRAEHPRRACARTQSSCRSCGTCGGR